jgi:hypothetical protein
MEEERYHIVISPGVIKGVIEQKTYNGETFGVYQTMSDILSGGTNGESLLTGLTIPLVFTETFNDIGFYDPFDGYILQKDIVSNFIVSSDPSYTYRVRLYNTSDDFKTFLSLSDYSVDWGDGATSTITTTSPQYITHDYPTTQGNYTITLTQTNPWGNTSVNHPISIPMTGATITNVNGNVVFTPQGGNWSGTPLSYDFIFDGDSDNTISQQTSDNFTSTPFVVSGYTTSKLQDLKLYGTIKYSPGVVINKNGQTYGQINQMNSTYTAYTINGVDYYDYSDGTSVFFTNSSGFTSDMLSVSAITKQEVLMNVVDSPEIQSNIFIERGKQSAMEGIQRLGEVDYMGDLIRYGYGFFKIKKQ